MPKLGQGFFSENIAKSNFLCSIMKFLYFSNKKIHMSHISWKKSSFFLEFQWELSHIFKDILFAYRNFFHWAISKLCISIWSNILGILIAIPFIILVIVFGFIDPIDWLRLFSSLEIQDSVFLEALAVHPFWFIFMILLTCTGILAFLLSWSYFLLLNARLALKYVERKKLDYKKNLYFSPQHILKFIELISWNFLYLLAPVMIWCGGIFFIYMLYNTQQIWFTTLSYSLLWTTIILIFALLYVSYRILFWYIILAQEKDSAHVHKARKYLYNSIDITQGRNIWKFFFVLILYSIIMTPFRMGEDYIQSNITGMKDTLAYKTKVIETIDAEDMPYYEYITKEYETYTNEELIDSIVMFSRVRIIYFIFSYFVFWGLFTLLMTSFYLRVLQKD